MKGNYNNISRKHGPLNVFIDLCIFCDKNSHYEIYMFYEERFGLNDMRRL